MWFLAQDDSFYAETDGLWEKLRSALDLDAAQVNALMRHRASMRLCKEYAAELGPRITAVEEACLRVSESAAPLAVSPHHALDVAAALVWLHDAPWASQLIDTLWHTQEL